jgi:SAM-dependent methyltransferase
MTLGTGLGTLARRVKRKVLGATLPESAPMPSEEIGEKSRALCASLGDVTANFSRENWVTVDLQEGADYICDFRKAALPFENSSLDGAHASHVIEHISAESAANLFRELYRCLKPGAVLRFSTPDMELLLDRYRANDWRWFLQADGYYVLANVIEGGFPPELLLMHNRLLGWFASYSGRLDTGGGEVIDQAIVDEKLAALDKYAFRDWCVAQLKPGRIYAHIHLWDFDEVAAALRAAGFTDIWRSSYATSESPHMAEPPIDREKHKLYSLYVEARR